MCGKSTRDTDLYLQHPISSPLAPYTHCLSRCSFNCIRPPHSVLRPAPPPPFFSSSYFLPTSSRLLCLNSSPSRAPCSSLHLLFHLGPPTLVHRPSFNPHARLPSFCPSRRALHSTPTILAGLHIRSFIRNPSSPTTLAAPYDPSLHVCRRRPCYDAIRFLLGETLKG